MITIIVRGLQSALAALAGIWTASRLGNGDMAKLAAVPITSAAALVIEYGLTVAPKRSKSVRKKLDPCSLHEGVWVQRVKAVETRIAGPEENKFAIFVVIYSNDTYAVDGTAYHIAGEEHSRWESIEPAQFSRDGRAMTYLWRGNVMRPDKGEENESRERRGVCTIKLSSDDSGSGCAEHLSKLATLIFDSSRVTQEMIEAWKPGATPELLRHREERDQFARYYSKRLRDETRDET